jgi:hypothetical protein
MLAGRGCIVFITSFALVLKGQSMTTPLGVWSGCSQGTDKALPSRASGQVAGGLCRPRMMWAFDLHKTLQRRISFIEPGDWKYPEFVTVIARFRVGLSVATIVIP